MTKKVFFAVFAAFVVLAVAVGASATCPTIKSGTILDSAGTVITVGFDKWGYNYQAHLFNGLYDNNTRPVPPVTTGDELEMKWNDAWMSNQDCDGDHLLDRHYGFASYIGSGAWLTNHQKGVYTDADGKQRWDYFSKIVAAPANATLVSGTWIAVDGTEIGPAIWGEFAIIQEIYTDSGTGEHGVLYLTPYSAGFGRFSPKN